MADDNTTCISNSTSFECIINGNAGAARGSEGITTKAFGLNLSIGLALFLFNLTGFFLLKSSDLGRRIYQPKTYLVPERLRVEPVPTNFFRWIHKIFTIDGDDLKLKCGLDGYFFIRFIRGMIVIFAPLMVLLVTILLPINYNDGKSDHLFRIGDTERRYNVTGLDTLAWQNVAPTHTNRYWAHLLCAILTIGWTLYRIYREKLHFIEVRQSFMLSPEYRLRSSARTILVTSIPSEYQSDEALKAFFDVFVDNDDRSKLHVWVNRDYRPLKALVQKRSSLRHQLEKEELRILRMVNKRRGKGEDVEAGEKPSAITGPSEPPASRDDQKTAVRHAYRDISLAFEADCRESEPLWQRDLGGTAEATVKIVEEDGGNWNPVPIAHFWRRNAKRKVPKTAWLRFEIARCTVEIDKMMRKLEDERLFARQNSAFIQFDRQMAANMACALVSHHLPGRMTPRYFDVAPHEILWPNMGLTSTRRFVRTCIALFLFLVMIFLWGLPTTFLGFLSQLGSLRFTVTWLYWLKAWPEWVISLISGPGSAILLALLVQLVVPALMRKLGVLVGAPTRSKRELLTQAFYFTFLFVELVLVTSISSGITAVIPLIINNPTTIASTLANNLPKAANYFFNYLIIQGLGFSGSVLFQYLRVLFITLIWPWHTQTPRKEAWLQCTIPHQMWGNVYPLFTNFAVIGLIYSVIAPLVLIFISGTFSLFWIAYRHNYYYVQRVKVDTHGMLFCRALTQLFTGIYVLEIALIGLFLLVRNTDNHAAAIPQAIIMIVTLVLTAAFQYIMDQKLRPLYDYLPVSLEDAAADAETMRFSHEHPRIDGADEDAVRVSIEAPTTPTTASMVEQPDDAEDFSNGISKKDMAVSSGVQKRDGGQRDGGQETADARRTLRHLRKRVAGRLVNVEARVPGQSGISRRLEAANQLGAAIAEYPDELSDLSVHERQAELRVAYQDPVTREPQPIIWIPQDPAGVSLEMIKRSEKYGKYLQYSNAGAYLTKDNKCDITRPPPDQREDWLLDWVL